jgi:hypothetical protein
MNTPASIFPRAWMASGQGEPWDCRSTYGTIPYEALPRIGHATEDLSWLDKVSPELRQVIGSFSTLNNSGNEIAHLDDVLKQVNEHKLVLPQSFERFMREPALQSKVPTSTDCFLALSDKIVPVLGMKGHYLLRFLNDSQSCVMWYLLLGQTENARVVASGSYFEPELFKIMEYEELQYRDVFREALLCADSFTEFLYRFWIENSIWFSSYKKLPLTPLQAEYQNQIKK